MPDIVSTTFQMLTALGIVLGGLLIAFYGVKRFLKRNDNSLKGRLIKIVASQYIGIKKNISLVEIPGSILVLGISNDNISLLAKIDDKNVLDALHQENEDLTLTFSDHLQCLTERLRPAKSKK